MRHLTHGMRRMTSRAGTTLLEVMIVLGLVAIMTSATAVYNREIQRQITLTQEHAVVLGMFIRARSAGLTVPQGDVDELVCGYGVHIDAASRTLTYFKDLGDFGAQSCGIARKTYDAGEEIERKVLSSLVTLTSDDVADLVYVPPFGRVYMNGEEAHDSASVVIASSEARASKGVKVNSFGQITEFTPTP